MKLNMATNMGKTKKNAVTTGKNKISAMSKSSAAHIVLIRILVIILTDVIVTTLFRYVRGEGMREYYFRLNTLPVLRIVFGALLASSVCYLVITLVKKIDTSAHWVTPAMLTALFLYLTILTVFYDKFTQTPFLFYTMTIIGSVLFAVYYIYTILLYKK